MRAWKMARGHELIDGVTLYTLSNCHPRGLSESARGITDSAASL